MENLELIIYRVQAKEGIVLAKFAVGAEAIGEVAFPTQIWLRFKRALETGAVPIQGQPEILKVTVVGLIEEAGVTPTAPKPKKVPAGVTTGSADDDLDDLLSIAGDDEPS